MGQDSFENAKEAVKAPKEPSLNLDMALVLKKIINHRINTYKTSVAEDAVLLQDSTLQGRARMATEVRLGEKEILVAALDSVKKRINSLSTTVSSYSLNQELPERGSTTKKIRL